MCSGVQWADLGSIRHFIRPRVSPITTVTRTITHDYDPMAVVVATVVKSQLHLTRPTLNAQSCMSMGAAWLVLHVDPCLLPFVFP